MRISTGRLYDQGVTGVQNQFSDLLKIQQQISTGRRVLTPADDPIAAARSLEVQQSQSANEQFTRNSKNAASALTLHESVLGQVGDLLQSVRVLAVNAGNPTLDAANRQSLATELQSNYDHLLALANTTDDNGQYLFAGYRGSTQPFSETTPGTVVYNGDQGQRLIQIGASRQVPVSSSGADVFQLIHNGNGTFVTAAAAANAGSGVVSPGNVLDPAKWNAAGNTKNYRIDFAQDTTVAPPVTTYDIVTNVATTINGIPYAAGTSLLTGVASAATASATGGPRYPRTYTENQAISFKHQTGDTNPDLALDLGIELMVQGQPVSSPTTTIPLTAKDSFSVKASTNQDIFTTLYNLITTLRGTGNNAAITNANNTALSNIDLAQENILSLRSTAGSTMKEVEAQRSTNDDFATQFKSTLSDLQDLDYAKAISDLTQKQVALEAAQKSFVKIQGLSLFNFLS